MKIKGKITLLVGVDGTTIDLSDAEAGVVFAKVKLTPEQLSSALSRLAYTPCDIEVSNTDKLGKKMENDTFVFEVPESIDKSKKDRNELLFHHAQGLLTDGWIASDYFASQDSFFWKDNKKFARCTIRRWV